MNLTAWLYTFLLFACSFFFQIQYYSAIQDNTNVFKGCVCYCNLLIFLLFSTEPVPGPGSYNPRVYRTSSKRCAPAFTMSRTPRVIGITRNCTF